MKQATTTAALATTGDSNPFRLTACTLATAAAAPKWDIDSRASHHMCNDRSSFSMFKTLSLLIVIKLGGNNSVTATHYGFVNVIQGYQVKALYTATFRHSLLSITQLDLGCHMTIFRIRSNSPHRSHLHPPSLSFSYTTLSSLQNTMLSHPSLFLHVMIMS